ncbi:hypothetical protein HDU98_000496 [Podochytrium sp. JEL0797]|nr:hypothetical protein HDU98_000496 [Podochytrium sp. JEL0797]
MDRVQSSLSKQATLTGYMILGVILAFSVIGLLFAIWISWQVEVVSKEFVECKDLDFSKILGSEAVAGEGGNAPLQRRESAIYELALLQRLFAGMVVAFSTLLKANANLLKGQQQNRPASVAVAPGAGVGMNGTGPRESASLPRNSSVKREDSKVEKGGEAGKEFGGGKKMLKTGRDFD